MASGQPADLIAAVATAAGRGGIGIVRLSGTALGSVACSLIGTLPQPRVATVARFLDAAGAEIDVGIALYFPAPHSYTGEDVLELQGHGGPGDRKSAAHQAERSLTGSMGFTAAEDVVPVLKKFGYAEAFRQAFPEVSEPVTPANYAAALEAYEETLITRAAFDRYLSGDDKALDAPEKRGLSLFISTGCADCHNGKLLGGDSIEKFGVAKD